VIEKGAVVKDARPIGVIFGAGNIGKGLLGELFQDAGLSIVFIEADPGAVASLSAEGEYALHLHGAGRATVRRIGPFEVHATGSAEASEALRRAQVCATAVGPANLEDVGRTLASACSGRERGPWNVLVCENDRGGAERLRRQLAVRGDRAPGCVQCSVERMVAGAEADAQGHFRVHAEAYSPLFAEGGSWYGPRPEWPGLGFVEDIGAYFDRKKYTNNFGHAVLGYLGAMKGYRFVWESTEDAEIESLLAAWLKCFCAALAEEYDVWSARELEAHVRSLLGERFANRALGDTIARVCRDPARKLGPQERMVGALRLLQRHGQPTDGFGRLIGAAALFALENEADRWPAPGAEAPDLEDALVNTTGLDRSSPPIREAMDFIRDKGGVR